MPKHLYGGSDVFTFTKTGSYDTDRIADFISDQGRIDVSDLRDAGFQNLTMNHETGMAVVSYRNWVDIELTGVSDPLTVSDFIFVSGLQPGPSPMARKNTAKTT